MYIPIDKESNKGVAQELCPGMILNLESLLSPFVSFCEHIFFPIISETSVDLR